MVALEPVKTFILPKDFAEEWIHALIHGPYDQGDSALFQQEYYQFEDTKEEDFNSPVEDSQCYCCLGVAGRVLGISDYLMMGCEVPADMEDIFRENGMPEILLLNCAENGLYTAVGVLTSLNDGMSYDMYQKLVKTFPHLVFPKIPMGGLENRFESVQYSFVEIAQFIKLNFKLVEE